jgi:SAM-dependent methyltransferase
MSLEWLRQIELENARRFLPPHGRVLEIGGGSGFQASLLASWGYDVVSIDIAPAAPGARSFFPVQSYDGIHIPFPDASFDFVFSSNVLEHVRAFPELLGETQRVLRPGGVAIHIVPSATWRLWTSILRYAAPPMRLLGIGGRGWTDGSESTAPVARRRWTQRLASIFVEAPHGEFPSIRAELDGYRRVRWMERLRAAGFDIVTASTTGIYYSANRILPILGRGARERLAKVLGASCHLFVVRPAPR